MPLFDITDEELEAFLNGFEKCEEVPPTVRCAGVPPKETKAAASKGQTCKRCNEFYEYADKPNQADGSFKCFSCRNY